MVNSFGNDFFLLSTVLGGWKGEGYEKRGDGEEEVRRGWEGERCDVGRGWGWERGWGGRGVMWGGERVGVGEGVRGVMWGWERGWGGRGVMWGWERGWEGRGVMWGEGGGGRGGERCDVGVGEV